MEGAGAVCAAHGFGALSATPEAATAKAMTTAHRLAASQGARPIAAYPLTLIVYILSLRVALGSATVAVVTASGVGLPLLAGSGVHPEIKVLAISCGSIAFSHVNDPGLWMFKEYFNLSVIDAIKARTTYTTVLSVLGLGGVLAMESVLDALSV
ncbi:hypothetical protein ACIBJF_27535 [Streptomyces sp. NPDC050743]|uniref:GntT/GntP/DsdX family permease n=1 Tax=Streptomyces sp. NPDC050743 TaxID=3365634 RepID=UPI0037AC4B2B